VTKYLGQIVAIESNLRKAATRRLTDAYHALDKPALLEGITGEYAPAVEDGEQLPGEELRVQATVEEMIEATRETLVAMFDAVAAKDFTNCAGHANADITVGEQVLVSKAPVPYILWLDKQLDDLQAFAQRIPTHSAATRWELFEARGVWKSEPVRTARQIQQHKVITLAVATQHHQAQAQVVAEPVTAGTWTRIKYTGAVPVARREEILRRIATLRIALKAAREEANRVEAIEPVVGARVLSYLFDE
jgi:hypothetical protein